MKRIVIAGAVAALFLTACCHTISQDKYVSAMVALGCKNATEETPEGAVILKEQGVTLEQIQAFRKKLVPRKVTPMTMEIAGKVAACHGVILQ